MLNLDSNLVIINHLLKYNPRKIGIFGSFARGDNKPGSDLDILIDFQDPVSLLQFVRIEQELSDMLGIKVDLVSSGALKNSKLKQYIEADLKVIFQL